MNLAPFLHLLVITVVIVGYVALSLTGHDGTPILTVLAGQGIGAGIQAAGEGNRGAKR